MRIAGEPNVLPSSTNPTLPYTINSVDELLDMVMVCHHLSHDIPEDVAVRRQPGPRRDHRGRDGPARPRRASACSRPTRRRWAASARPSPAPSRPRTTARTSAASCPRTPSGNDNFRVLRYLAKLTINPAIAHGIAEHVGSLEPGKLADIVLWPIDVVRRQAEAGGQGRA